MIFITKKKIYSVMQLYRMSEIFIFKINRKKKINKERKKERKQIHENKKYSLNLSI